MGDSALVEVLALSVVQVCKYWHSQGLWCKAPRLVYDFEDISRLIRRDSGLNILVGGPQCAPVGSLHLGGGHLRG